MLRPGLVDRRRPRRQPERHRRRGAAGHRQRRPYAALAHYFAELTALEEELSMSARLVHISDELAALADACRRTRFRADEPYRRALAGHPRHG